MNSQKILVLCAFLCIVVLSTCFSPWGNDTHLAYTITFTNSKEESFDVPSTYVTPAPIVISVPPGTWTIEVRADAVEDDAFAATRLRFRGWKETLTSEKEENYTFSIDELTPTIEVNNWDQISRAFNGDWDKFLKEVGWKPKNNSQKYYIELLDTPGAPTYATTSAILDGDNNKNVVLWTGKNVTIKRSNGLTSPLFQVKKGTLTLGGENDQGTIIIDGNKSSSSDGTSPPDNDSLITVFGELIMYEGVTLTNNKKTTNYGYVDDNIGGGGVYVGTNGTFTMHGGTISNNEAIGNAVKKTEGHGGGVRVRGGVFYMDGGTISGNEAEVGGGVRVSRDGTFIMSDGKISDRNKASKDGGGVSIGATFTMEGGTISGNTANDGGGVSVHYGGSFTKTNEGGIIYGIDDISDLRNNITNKGNTVYVITSYPNTTPITSKYTNSTINSDIALHIVSPSTFTGGSWNE